MGIRGVTTNPSIFEKKARADGRLRRHILAMSGRAGGARRSTRPHRVDVQARADYLLPSTKSGGEDGYVSLEVNPAIAHDYRATVRGHQLAELVSRKTP